MLSLTNWVLGLGSSLIFTVQMCECKCLNKKLMREWFPKLFKLAAFNFCIKTCRLLKLAGVFLINHSKKSTFIFGTLQSSLNAGCFKVLIKLIIMDSDKN